MSVPVQMPLPLPPPQPGTADGELLGERLVALLERRGRPLEVGHVASQLLRLAACPERLQRRLVAQIVESDGRLAWHGRDLVGLAPQGWGGTRVDEATFCVVDLETTGGAPGRSKITEIGAVRLEGLRIVERFSTLVDPERPVPAVISELTGITAEMLEGAPTIDEAMEDFAAFAGDAVLVAHNAPFDLRFLNYERRRTVGRYFTQPWLDTLVLARRLLRDRIERHNLRSLADWAGTDARPCHRALPDAEATAEVLTALVPLLQQRGTVTLQDAVLFATPRVNRYAHKLALAEDLPAGPGVYLMKDAAGKVLYVGKAGNLKRRVRSYFGPGGQHSRRIGRALSELERVEHEPTGSEFEALLREGELIRDLRPPCNHRGLRVRGHYLKLTVQEAYPRVIVVDTPTDDDAAYFGPLRSPRLVAEARRVLQAAYPVRACHPICRPGNALGGCAGGPCGVEDPERYAAATTALADLLSGDAGEMGRLPARLAQAFADGALSRGDQDTDAIAGLLRVLASLGRVRALGRLSGVVVEPAVEQRRTNLFFIGGGRLVHRAQVAGQAWRPTASDGLAAIAASERRRLEPLTLPDLDVAGLVEDRLREPHPDGGVRLDSGWEPADAMAALDRALTARRGGRSSRRAPRAA